jgi:hypothetical protein
MRKRNLSVMTCSRNSPAAVHNGFRGSRCRTSRYANAGVTKGEQPDTILQFVGFWKKHTGKPPAELVFDLQLTTTRSQAESGRL